MNGIIRNVSKKTINTKDGRKFDKIVIKVDVILEGGEVKQYKSEMSTDYAKRYFGHCGIAGRDLPGKYCDVTLRKRAFETDDGKTAYVTEIKYLNMLDDKGEPIIMRNKVDETVDDLGF